MAKCSGCSGACGCHISPTGTGITVAGDGSSGSPWVVNSSGGGCNCHLSPTGTNVTVTGDGSIGTPWVVNASGGGGACTQKNMYTVATVGPSGLGLYLGTDPAFLACADFVGDGINDNVAIQSAVTAALAPYNPAVPLPAEIYLNSGVFATSAFIDLQGVPIKGAYNTFITNNAVSSGFNLLRNPGFVSDIAVGEVLAALGAAPIKVTAAGANPMWLDNVSGTTSGLGADLGFIHVTIGTGYKIKNCQISSSTGGALIPLIYEAGNTSPNKYIENGFFIGMSLELLDHSGANMLIRGNRFFGNSTVAVTGNRGIINIIISTVTTVQHHEISENHIIDSPGHGIVIDGGAGGGRALRFLIHDNLIDNYGTQGVTAYDGIFLAGNADEHDIQSNICHSTAAGARSGVNVSAATCNDNFVTNNNLFNSGGGVSFNDSGTATISAAGNRL